MNRIPIWAWALGCVSLLLLCAALILVAVLFFLPIFRSTGAEIATLPPVAVTVPVEQIVSPTATVEATAERATELPSPTAVEEATPEVEPTPTASAAPGQDEHASERSEIEANVIDIRGLTPNEPVVPTFLTAAQLRERLEEDLAEDYSRDEARGDSIVLSAFDFVDPSFELYEFTLDLLTEQIAGFYDPETAEFVVISDDGEFDTLEQLTHAHEYVHALQDQYYELELLDDDSLDDDASLALRALAEGDATLVQQLYVLQGFFDANQLMDILSGVEEISTEVLDSAPPVLARELLFPYEDGLSFVQFLYEQGGFRAVNDAWEQLPQSTEQVLHPDRYLIGDAPQLVSLAPLTDTLGLGWQRLDENVLGELFLREYLAQQLDSAQLDGAAAGWGGDRYAVYWHEEDDSLVMVLRLAWDAPADADEFAAAYAEYPARLFGTSATNGPDGSLCWQGSDIICLFQSDDESLIVRAPNVEVVTAVASAVSS